MAWDDVWESIFQKKEWGKYPSEHVIRFVAKNFYQGHRENTKILEIGCGTGSNIWYLARERFDAYGIDGSETAIQLANDRLSEEKLKADMRVGDIIVLPYNDNYFDAVIDNECIYSNNLNDSEAIMKEVCRTLKKEGVFFSRTFADDTYIGRISKKAGHLEYTDISDGPFAGAGFARLIDKEGIMNLYGKFFNILSIDKIGHTVSNGEIFISEWIIIGRKK